MYLVAAATVVTAKIIFIDSYTGIWTYAVEYKYSFVITILYGILLVGFIRAL